MIAAEHKIFMKGGSFMLPFAILLEATPQTLNNQVTNITDILGIISTVAGIILTCWLFLVPQALKVGGKAIGWAKSLMGTGGRRRR